MMTPGTFMHIAGEARADLKQYHLHDAMQLIGTLLPEVTENADMMRIHESIRRDYTAMLDFLADGGKDPLQTQMQCRMVQKAFLLLNEIEIRYKTEQPDEYWLRIPNSDVLEEESLEGYFYKGLGTEITSYLKEEEVEAWIGCHTEQQARMFISGLTLSLTEHYNPFKMQFLCHAAYWEGKALVAVMLTSQLHADVIPLFPEVESLLKEVLCASETEQWRNVINYDIFMASQTEVITHHVKTEIIPNLFKGIQDEQMGMGFFDEDDEEDAFKKMLRENTSSVTPLNEKDKIEFKKSALEWINLQREGADMGIDILNHATSHAFFQNLSNWFLPFDTHNKEIESYLYYKGKPIALLKALFAEQKICDIDRYALVLLLSKSMNGKMMEMMQGITSMVESAEAVAGTDYSMEQCTPEEDISNYVKTLYRLFQKSRWKHITPKFFTENLNLLDNAYLKPALTTSSEDMLKMAKGMIKYDQPVNALQYLNLLTASEGSTSEILQLTAECLQKTKNYNKALMALIQADVLSPDNTWILAQMISCYAYLGRQEEQLECLLRLEQLMPDSAKITRETGLCLMKMERYQEAAQRFYKLEIEEKQLIPSMRAIAWCSFKQKKYETALRYYKKIFGMLGNVSGTNMKGNANIWADYLNAGHTAWMLDDMLSAQSFYHLYVKFYLAEDAKRTNALAPFDKDKDELLAHGKSQHEIDLMHDIILYRC